MSTVSLRIIGRECRNERYRTNSIFPLKHERKISACAPVRFPPCPARKLAVIDMSFRQRAVIEFLVKEGNSAEVIYERLRGVYGDACMGYQQCQKGGETFLGRKHGHRPSAALWSTENCCNWAQQGKIDELIRQDRRITFREIAARLAVGHHAVQEIMEILGYSKVCSCWVSLLPTGTEEHKTIRK
jgi:hypothetical protein